MSARDVNMRLDFWTGLALVAVVAIGVFLGIMLFRQYAEWEVARELEQIKGTHAAAQTKP